MDIVKLWRLADADMKSTVQAMAGGAASEDDLALAKVIANIAVDANYGDKQEAKLYLDRIQEKEPALRRLMARIGIPITESQLSNKN